MSPHDTEDHGDLPVSRDERFIRNVRETILTNLEDEKFRVEHLASALSMSRAQLYRRLHRLTGKNISQYIREVRLERAMELLRHDAGSVAEIAYKVGFGSPAYFNKCFHEHYGDPPGKFARSLDEKTGNIGQHTDEALGAVPDDQLKSSGWNGKQKFWLIFGGVGGIAIILLLAVFIASIKTELRPVPSGKTGNAIPEKSIALLPFNNKSPDKADEYFCFGIQEEILSHLKIISDLEIKSFPEEQNPATSKNPINTDTALNVSFLLEGSVRKSGNRFRIRARLIDSQSGNETWAETYEGVVSDTIFQIINHITRKIASSLQVTITPEEKTRIGSNPTANIRAFDMYMRGRYETMMYGKTGDTLHLNTAHEFIKNALEIDPDILMDFVQKDDIFITERELNLLSSRAGNESSIHPSINRRGNYLLGEYYVAQGMFDLAIENFLKAIELPPHDDQWLLYNIRLGSIYLNQKNDELKALRYLQNGLQLGMDRLSQIYPLIIGSFISIGDYDRAEKYIKKSIEAGFSCTNYIDYCWLNLIQGKYERAGEVVASLSENQECNQLYFREQFQVSLLKADYKKAEQYFNQWKSSGMHWRSSDQYYQYQIGFIYYQLGRYKEADDVFNEQIKILHASMVENPEWIHSTYMNLSRIYAFTGKHDEALTYLKKYAETGFSYGWHDFIEKDPFFESLYDNPEFKTIVLQARRNKKSLRSQLKQAEVRGEINL